MTGSVGIVGSRHYRPVALIATIIDRLEETHPDGLTIVSGGEPTGVDTAVADECRSRGYHECMKDLDGIAHLTLPFHIAELLPEGKGAAAKFARNSQVVRHIGELIALFDVGPKSPGTRDTVNKALKAGLPVHVHHRGRWTNGYDA